MTYLHWYPPDQDEEEKRLILKLDLSILIFGCLSFFTKYLDQQSITNAYVRFVSPYGQEKSFRRRCLIHVSIAECERISS